MNIQPSQTQEYRLGYLAATASAYLLWPRDELKDELFRCLRNELQYEPFRGSKTREDAKTLARIIILCAEGFMPDIELP